METTIFKEMADLEFLCEDEFSLCVVIFSEKAEIIFFGGHVKMTRLHLKFAKTSNYKKQFISGSFGINFNFKNCLFAGGLFEDGLQLLNINGGRGVFTNSTISLMVLSLGSKFISLSNQSSIFFDECRIKDAKLSNQAVFFSISHSSLKIRNVNFTNITVTQQDGLPGSQESSLKSFIILSESDFDLDGLLIEKFDQASYYFLRLLKSCGQNLGCPKSEIKNVKITEYKAQRGGFAILREIQLALVISSLRIQNSIFINSSKVFAFETLKDPSFILSSILIIDCYFDLFFELKDVNYSSFQNIHIKNNNTRLLEIFAPMESSEALIYNTQFLQCNISNVTVNNIVMKLPTLIFENPSTFTSGTVLISNSSFFNILVKANDKESSLGNFHGGVLSFYEVQNVLITDTLFKENVILKSNSIMGSVAIYFDSKEKTSLFIKGGVFLSNKVGIGPYLISFTGFQFFMNESFISNTSPVDNGALGLSLIKLRCSLVDIFFLKAFNNLMTDGLISIIESFSFNRVFVKNLTVCNSISLKRAAGSLLLDGSSKNREVVLQNSLFINNSANTQSAGGVHIFHTNMFTRLNITYFGNAFYYNYASLGTLWWLRAAKKNAFFWIIGCEFYSSFTFFRPPDLGIGYVVGAEMGSFFTIKDSVINRSVCQKYTILIKDIYVLFENLTLINQLMKNQDASQTFLLKGMIINISNSLIANQYSKSTFFDINDNVSMVITNTKFREINTSGSLLFSIMKSSVKIIDSLFINIKVDFVFKLSFAGGKDSPCVFQNNYYAHSEMNIFMVIDSIMLLKGNKYENLRSNLFMIDSTRLEVVNDYLSHIDSTRSTGLPPACILKALNSDIAFSFINSSNMTSSNPMSFFYLRSSNFSLADSNFTNIASKTNKGLITSRMSSVWVNRSNLLCIQSFILDSLRSSIILFGNAFLGSKNFSMSFFLQINETRLGIFSSNIFKSAKLEKAAITAFSLEPGAYALTISKNWFEDLASYYFQGSGIHIENVDANISNNTFYRNKALEAGAVFVYCDISEPGNERKECDWNLTDNLFEQNSAEKSTGGLKWAFIAPLNESGNVYSNNFAPNGLQFKSFAARLSVVNFENINRSNVNKMLSVEGSFIIKDQISGKNLPGFKIDVLDTYGQIIEDYFKLKIEIVKNISQLKSSNEASNFLKTFINENEVMNSKYEKKESIYKEKAPTIFGRTILLRSETNSSLQFFLNETFLVGTPAYTIFINLSSPDFIFNKRNLSLSSLYNFLNSSKEKPTENEIRTPVSYSFILPTRIALCGIGTYLDSEKNICEPCGSNHQNFKYNQTECSDCPEGLICKDGNNVEVAPGFWRNSNTSSQVYECEKSLNNCLGGVNSSCASEYEGVLCSICKENDQGSHMQNSYGLRCSECPPVVLMIVVVIFFCSLMFVFLWQFNNLFFSNQNSPKKQVVLKSLINYSHTFILLSTYNNNGGILFGTYLGLLQRLSLVLNFWFSLECLSKVVTSLRYFSIKYFSQLLYFHIFLFIFLRMRYRKYHQMAFNNLRIKYLEETLLLWYMFYPAILHHLVHNSMCINLYDQYHLLVEPNQICLSTEISSSIFINAVLLTFWMIYLPLKILKELRLIKGAFNSSDQTQNILQVGYKEKFSGIEINHLFFKTALVSINASSIKGEFKVLLMWPIFFFYLLLESKTWRHFRYSVQVQGQILVIVNFLLLAYGCMWLTFDGSSFNGGMFFTLSLILQVYFFITLFYSYFNIPMPIILKKALSHLNYFSQNYKKTSETQLKQIEKRRTVLSKTKFDASSFHADLIQINLQKNFEVSMKSLDSIPEEISTQKPEDRKKIDINFQPCPSAKLFLVLSPNTSGGK